MVEAVCISKEELYGIIRKAVRDEIERSVENIPYISDEEQEELEKLHGKVPSESEVDFEECVEL